MTIWFSRVYTDSRGNTSSMPDLEHPHHIKVNVATDRQTNAELIGQVEVKVLKCVARKLPLGSYVRIDFRGEQWDMANPPTFSRFTKASSHVEFIIRSRNQPHREG